MGKEMLTLGNIEIKNTFYQHKTHIFLKDVDIALHLTRFPLVKKTTLLVICIMLISLSHYI